MAIYEIPIDSDSIVLVHFMLLCDLQMNARLVFVESLDSASARTRRLSQV